MKFPPASIWIRPLLGAVSATALAAACVTSAIPTATADDPPPAPLHNVHYNPDINPPDNFGMIEPGQQRVVSFKQPEIFKVSCDVHSWMTAWVAVFDHPYFNVTTDAGAFNIVNLPPGSYKLICWHERFGKLEKQIEISDKDLSTDFTYKAPD